MAYRETPRMRARKAATRERILAATRQLITAGGFNNASIAKVASEAEIAIGSVYRHFESKSELFAEVFRTATQIEVHKVAEALNQGSNHRENLQEALRVFSRRALRNPTMAWALIAEPVDPQVDVERLHYRQAYAEHFERTLADGIRCGEFAPQNPKLSSAAVVGAIAEALVGPLSPAANNLTPEDASQLIDDIVRFCLQAVQPLRDA